MAGPIKNQLILILLLAASLSGCSITPRSDSGPPRGSVDVSHIPNATPKDEPRSRYGNPKSYVVRGKRYYVQPTSQGHVERGLASWYGNKFHGRRTSSGETYDMYGMTAAHKTLPLPTYARVTSLENGRNVVVKINDRGPFHGNRIIDLSYTAASKLGILAKGTGMVEVVALSSRQPVPPAPRQIRADGKKPSLYIQIGAFSNRYNANQLAKRLANSLDRSIRVKQSYSNGNEVFRVQVGPLLNTEQADNLSEKLAQLGISGLHVILD
ncbi:septal ring lytic transglycosylase RlpA family protein [Pseudomonadota bacterium]